MAVEAKAAAMKMVRAAVTRGHTVMKDDMEYGPGAIVELPADESRRLTVAGFLADPAASPLPLGNGPVFSSETSMISQPGADGR